MSADELKKQKNLQVDLMLIGMSFIWGLNFTVIKSTLNYFSPMVFNAIRFTAASLLLLAILKLKEKSIKIDGKDVKQFLLLAIIGNSLYQFLFINGISCTTAGNSSLILATTPIFVALLGSVTGVEKIGRRFWQYITLSFIGVSMIIIGSGKPLALTIQSLIGDMLILAGTICWSAYTVLSKPLLNRYSPLKLTTVTITLGTPPLIILAIPYLLTQNWNMVGAWGWLGLAYSSCLAVAIGYTIWYSGVSHVGGAKTSMYEYLITVIAVAAAWLLLNETMTLIQLLGATLTLTGLYFSRKHK
ncbi:MAG: DMT family transporter [Candidatus Bathyarchaeota archaeon]|nr:DMT family transporter [Candidatus Bathyarchaeota archaeon]MCX8176873.1 DMT family transporter [Candidatus Bathyarchaeota archaeon]MDW8193442.1 DMT family transporter [Nitrososphaerota archaeon]